MLVGIVSVALLVFEFALWFVICADLLLCLIWLVLVIVVCVGGLFAVFGACRILLDFACGLLGLLCALVLRGLCVLLLCCGVFVVCRCFWA